MNQSTPIAMEVMMKYRNLGASGLKVSELGLGSWLTFGGYVDRDLSKKIIHYAYENGVNFFDTANMYGKGEAEQVMGEALKPFPRSSYVLATKVYFPMGDGPNDRGLSRKHIMEQCEASLKRLGVDYIDLYQCHRYDHETPLEETLHALDDLVRQGKILYYGVSKWDADQIRRMVRICEERQLHKPISNQPPYNLLDRTIEESVIPVCEELGIGQIVYSPLAQGVLTGKYRVNQSYPKESRAMNPTANRWMGKYMDQNSLKKTERLWQIASDLGVTLSQMALAWNLRLKNIASCIIGVSSIEQLEENMKAVEVKLDEEILKQIEDELSGI